jgi:hydrogenase expression/formation protein HypC
MCLAVPGQIVSLIDPGGDAQTNSLLRSGKVSFSGILREVNLAYVPEAQVGDYVIVHVGFALSLLDEAEALQTLADIRHLSPVASGDLATATIQTQSDRTLVEDSHDD